MSPRGSHCLITNKYVETVSENVENFKESVEERATDNATPMFSEESDKRFSAMSGFSHGFEVPFNSVARNDKINYFKIKDT